MINQNTSYTPHHTIPNQIILQYHIQKRAMRVILPSHSYDKVLQLVDSPRLNDRRNDISMKTLLMIAKGGPLVEYITQTRDCAH